MTTPEQEQYLRLIMEWRIREEELRALWQEYGTRISRYRRVNESLADLEKAVDAARWNLDRERANDGDVARAHLRVARQEHVWRNACEEIRELSAELAGVLEREQELRALVPALRTSIAGHPLHTRPPPISCASCNRHNLPDAARCQHCGRRI